MNPKHSLPCAGLILLAGACATGSKQASGSPNPTTNQVAASQQSSEEALKRAEEAQKQATDQSNKAAAAQARVRQDEEKLGQDQEAALSEQAQAQQLQERVRQQTHQTTQEIERQQAQAAAALAEQTQMIAHGQQLATGVVTRVRPDEVTIQPASGQRIKFSVDSGTKVQIAGRRSSADKIKEGQEARVAYQASPKGPTAVSIQVQPLGSASQKGAESNDTNSTTESGAGSGGRGGSQ